jgi:hypothetical protein
MYIVNIEAKMRQLEHIYIYIYIYIHTRVCVYIYRLLCYGLSGVNIYVYTCIITCTCVYIYVYNSVVSVDATVRLLQRRIYILIGICHVYRSCSAIVVSVLMHVNIIIDIYTVSVEASVSKLMPCVYTHIYTHKMSIYICIHIPISVVSIEDKCYWCSCVYHIYTS